MKQKIQLTPPKNSKLVFDNHNPEVVAGLIMLVAWENFSSPGIARQIDYVRSLVEAGYSLPVALAIMAYRSSYFVPDITTQTIRTPQKTIRDAQGNCVDLTVLICAIALHFTSNIFVQIADYGQGVFTHVYPIVNDVVVDVVPFQVQDGTEIKSRNINQLPNFHTFETPRSVKTFNLWKLKS
jgi:hypothetical protein